MIQRLAQFSKRIALGLFLLFYSNILFARFAYPAYDTANISFDRYSSVGNENRPIREYRHIIANKPIISFDERNTTNPVDFSTLNLRNPGILVEEKFDGGGPTQPEMQSFSSVNNTNMVDLFTGDFSYNIPLLDVGGYPVNISYRSGVTMDQEASWVGLGWNINPGTITRNMRGLPDDFNGGKDTITKTATIKENKTVGVSAGANSELTGISLPIGLNASVGIFTNNYKGWGLETSLNATLNAGVKGFGSLTSGLSVTNNSQEGLTIAPSLAVAIAEAEAKANGGIAGSLSTSLSYNSRTGLKGLQLQAGLRQFETDVKNQAINSGSSEYASSISFATPSYTPTITMPYTSNLYSFTGKVGSAITTLHPNLSLTGYVTKQRIDAKDVTQVLPAFGYLNYQKGSMDKNALLDFNREKEIAYREKPAVAHIAVPNYTYDLFSVTGEGTGGMFRAYRSDIGFIYDHNMKTKSESLGGSVDVGSGNIFHGGVDINLNRSFTENSAWLNENAVKNNLSFKRSDSLYESVYFRNPGEKAINSKLYYDSLGGDDVVAVNLYQGGSSSSIITATNFLNRYRNKSLVGQLPISSTSTIKKERDKRSQVITYLTAKEASEVGFSKYIESYGINKFSCDTCARCFPNPTDVLDGTGTGLIGEYFNGENFEAKAYQKVGYVNFSNPSTIPGLNQDHFSIRWTGRLKAPDSGSYKIVTTTDDGFRLWINDSLFKNDWKPHSPKADTAYLNLVAGEVVSIKFEYFESGGTSIAQLSWIRPGGTFSLISANYLYSVPPKDSYTNVSLTKEKRINTFRQHGHISEMTVLNADGRRYIYGIPVYNLLQKEATFSIDSKGGSTNTGLVHYAHDTDNTVKNQRGNDNYFSSEIIPAYAHSFLLTAIVSPDYVDLAGDGISDDDRGDAIKFNYSKVSGILNPFKWRAPFGKNIVTYNEGLKTDTRDDKGNYVYGEKELWYLHSLESKSMIATFTVEERSDGWGVNERGDEQTERPAKKLKEINLYSKADFLKNGSKATAIKTVHFRYSYKLCKGLKGDPNDLTGKLTLDTIWFSYNGNDKGKLNPYVFSYHSNNPSYNIKSYDKWGNYKDPLQNPGSTASNLITNAEYPYALKDSATSAINAGAWNLNNVTLPSGGRINVTYESDDYAYVQNRRAMEMFKIYGFGATSSLANASLNLFGSKDNLYVFVKLSSPVANTKEAFSKYLEGVNKIYFKLSVQMPTDKYGMGYEYVPCYAELDAIGGYGIADSTTMWMKLKGISIQGDKNEIYSPLATAAIQFLRLNLPSKAYPGSEVGNNVDLRDAVSIVLSQADNIRNAFRSFDAFARKKPVAYLVDTSRTFVRLNSPNHKKLGGGHRVKRVEIFDNWNSMTGQKESSYGQEYNYTTIKEINGKQTRISSGVAGYEPMIGSEENPFHLPIEYVEKIAPLGPVTLGYTEEPLGEAFFPSAGVGYSKVRVRSIHTQNKKSANGYEETEFYTAFDFPTVTDRSMLDKKRYKPALANFLKINAKHFISLSQGFKVELNDMHGKIKTQATYAETDSDHPLTYTRNIYKVENHSVDSKQLSNRVTVMSPDGIIDTAGIIGKDVELMMDMRQQVSVVNGNNYNVNGDFFALPFPPVFLIPSFFGLPQREETQFRSVATTKIIQRYGILDSVIHIDKGSVVSTKNMMYDSETGDVLLTRTQNEFNDPVYNFTYPSHWAYEGMGLAYKNIGAMLYNASIKNGKIVKGLRSGIDTVLFASGDEILVASKSKTSGADCDPAYATFPNYSKVWAIDANVVTGGARQIYFINADGTPFSGNDVSLKVIRSGRRNVSSSLGSVVTLANPLRYYGGRYTLKFDDTSRVINASALEIKQQWKVAELNKKAVNYTMTCPPGYTYSTNLRTCTKDTIVYRKDTAVSICIMQITYPVYSGCGSFIYSFSDTNKRTPIDSSNSFWKGTGATGCPTTGYAYRNIADSTSSTNFQGNSVLPPPSANPCDPNPSPRIGPLNRSGIWACCKDSIPNGKWFSFTVPIYFPETRRYYFASGGDNRVKITIDNQLFVEDRDDLEENFKEWYIRPKNLTSGIHYIKIEGYNQPVADNITNPAGFGVEIYGNDSTEISNATSYEDLNLIFSTKDLAGRKVPEAYSCPSGYGLVYEKGDFKCRKLQLPDINSSSFCYSPITDTLVNPYSFGLLGNWRQQKTYAFYGDRKEQLPSSATDLRNNGTFSSFKPFWNFVSIGNNKNRLSNQADTTKWVWNSEMTLFNSKGAELENKDPLGRYNAGLYGYNNSLPVAVVQNSRYREAAFEGFEDYDFASSVCDTACPVSKHFDFTPFKAKRDTLQRHTGRYSLRVNSSDNIGIAAAVVTTDTTNARLTIDTVTNACNTLEKALNRVKTSSNSLLPIFSPLSGKELLVSAWVKEEKDCKCEKYTGNSIQVTFKRSNQPDLVFSLYPSGNIIEGWQRYEDTVDIPVNATSIAVNFKATSSSAVYFDDIRIHPFSANMKSFVYHPVNLRLMAELDENNYATYYEYDDDGTLVRVKKETQRGIKTIKETRSALLKQGP